MKVLVLIFAEVTDAVNKADIDQYFRRKNIDPPFSEERGERVNLTSRWYKNPFRSLIRELEEMAKYLVKAGFKNVFIKTHSGTEGWSGVIKGENNEHTS